MKLIFLIISSFFLFSFSFCSNENLIYNHDFSINQCVSKYDCKILKNTIDGWEVNGKATILRIGDTIPFTVK